MIRTRSSTAVVVFLVFVTINADFKLFCFDFWYDGLHDTFVR